MELGKNLARIVDYGTTKTKGGAPQVFISFQIGSETSMWYGSPYKKDSDEVNDMCLIQLAYCGFDANVHELNELYTGTASNVLITDEDIDVFVADETMPNGDLKRRIKTIGEFGPVRVKGDDLFTAAKKQNLKASAGKFKVRARKNKENPDQTIPF